jgi:hypothetical protein
MNCTYFSIDELVCEDVYNKFGTDAFKFFDPRLLITIDTLRDRIGRPIFINDWQVHGKFSQRGLRCLKCEIVQDKIMSGELYMSAHCLGKAVDMEVQGMLAEETRQWIINNAKWWPYSIRLESDVNWVHLDLYNNSNEKVILFKA